MKLEYKLAYTRILKAIKYPAKQVSVRKGILHFGKQTKDNTQEASQKKNDGV